MRGGDGPCEGVVVSRRTAVPSMLVAAVAGTVTGLRAMCLRCGLRDELIVGEDGWVA